MRNRLLGITCSSAPTFNPRANQEANEDNPGCDRLRVPNDGKQVRPTPQKNQTKHQSLKRRTIKDGHKPSSST
jgi:hypothetical protein